MIRRLFSFLQKRKIILILCLLFFLFFRNAFTTFFFNDDFYFLKISRQFDLFSFLSPIRSTFYRPLPTEFFYFFLHKAPFPIFTGHFILFAVFLIGVIFLYKNILLITKNKELAAFSCILYLFHFSHVYQLYWFATFQEIALFTFTLCSLYFLLKKQFLISIILFLCALLSKEQAILVPFVLFFFYAIKHKKIHRIFIAYLLLDIVFVGIDLYIQSHMPILSEYVIHLSPRLIINNVLWYGLWSVGFPAMMSDYMRSIFSLPFGGFWHYFAQQSFIIYFFGMLLFTVSLILCYCVILIRNRNDRRVLITFPIVGLLLFIFSLLPVLPIIHKWMVRLTLPLIFPSMIGGLILSLLWRQKKAKPLVIIFIALYLAWNYFGIQQHEAISTYMLESSITTHARAIFQDKKRFETCTAIYIQDPKNMKMSSWEGSEKIALTFAGASFLSYYFPERAYLDVKYEYRKQTRSNTDCVVEASELIK